MITFKEFINKINESKEYSKEELKNLLSEFGEVSVPAIGNSGVDIHIMVKNKKELKGLKEKVVKLLKTKYGLKLKNTEMIPNGYAVQAPWPENKNEEDNKPWEAMFSFK